MIFYRGKGNKGGFPFTVSRFSRKNSTPIRKLEIKIAFFNSLLLFPDTVIPENAKSWRVEWPLRNGRVKLLRKGKKK